MMLRTTTLFLSLLSLLLCRVTIAQKYGNFLQQLSISPLTTNVELSINDRTFQFKYKKYLDSELNLALYWGFNNNTWANSTQVNFGVQAIPLYKGIYELGRKEGLRG